MGSPEGAAVWQCRHARRAIGAGPARYFGSIGELGARADGPLERDACAADFECRFGRDSRPADSWACSAYLGNAAGGSRSWSDHGGHPGGGSPTCDTIHSSGGYPYHSGGWNAGSGSPSPTATQNSSNRAARRDAKQAAGTPENDRSAGHDRGAGNSCCNHQTRDHGPVAPLRLGRDDYYGFGTSENCSRRDGTCYYGRTILFPLEFFDDSYGHQRGQLQLLSAPWLLPTFATAAVTQVTG